MSGVMNQFAVTDVADSYCSDQPSVFTVVEPRLKSSTKSYVSGALWLPPPACWLKLRTA